MKDLNRAQRIVLVIGWAAVLAAFGTWATAPDFGTGTFTFPAGGFANGGFPVGGSFVSGAGLVSWERMLVWWALAVVWTAGALWALGSLRLPKGLVDRPPGRDEQ